MKLKHRDTGEEITAIQYCGQRNLPKVLDFILDGHMDYSHLPISPLHAKRGVAIEAKTGNIIIPAEVGVYVCRSGDWVGRNSEGKFGSVNQLELDANYEDNDPKQAAVGSDECAVGKR